jgi:hypothetical protein
MCQVLHQDRSYMNKTKLLPSQSTHSLLSVHSNPEVASIIIPTLQTWKLIAIKW